MYRHAKLLIIVATVNLLLIDSAIACCFVVRQACVYRHPRVTYCRPEPVTDVPRSTIDARDDDESPSPSDVEQAYMGVRVRDVGKDAETLDMPDARGAIVLRVVKGTSAAKVGLDRLDVIRKVDGQIVSDAAELVETISSNSPGVTVELEVWREGQPTTITVRLQEFGRGEQVESGVFAAKFAR